MIILKVSSFSAQGCWKTKQRQESAFELLHLPDHLHAYGALLYTTPASCCGVIPASLAVFSHSARRCTAEMASHSLPAPLAAFQASATYRSQVQEILSRREAQRQTVAFSDPKKLAKIPFNVLSQEARNAFKANHAIYELNTMRNRYVCTADTRLASQNTNDPVLLS
jgi:hypothetical protein